MEYRFNDDQNKKILAILIILVILVISIGGIIIYSNNDKLAVMTRVDALFKNGVNSGFNAIKEYNMENMVTDGTFNVNMENTDNDNKITNELLNGKLHANFTKENEYKIIELNTNVQGQEVGNGIYEKNGIIYLKVNGATYQLNENEGDSQIKYKIEDVQEMYNLIYSTAKKQLNDLDFYRIKEETTKQVKIGLSLDDDRLKEIVMNTLDSLKANKKFIELYARMNNIDNTKVVEEVNKLIENIKSIETDKNNVTKLEIYVSGFLNENTDKIIITRKESSVIKFTSYITVSDNNVNIDVEKNNRKLNISISKIQDKYTISMSGYEFSIKLDLEKYNMVLNANIGEYVLYFDYVGDIDNNKELIGKGTIAMNLDSQNKLIVNYDIKTSYEGKEEKVDLGEVKSSNELLGNLMMLNSMGIY